MESQKVAGTLGGLIAAIVLAAAFYYAPKGVQIAPKAAVEKAEAPKGPVVQDVTPGAPAVRGPVVRDIPQ